MTTTRPSGTPVGAPEDPAGTGTGRSDSRARILRSALGLFARHGYDGTSLKAIAGQVGVSTPALYWHFESKDEIYHAAVEQMLDDFLDAVRGTLRASEPLPRFRELVAAHVRWQLERREEAGVYAQTMGMRQLAASLSPEQQDRILQMQRSYLDEWRTILARGRDDGVFHFADLRTTAFAVISLCEYVHTWFNPEGALSIDAVVDLYVDLALRMVGGH